MQKVEAAEPLSQSSIPPVTPLTNSTAHSVPADRPAEQSNAPVDPAVVQILSGDVNGQAACV